VCSWYALFCAVEPRTLEWYLCVFVQGAKRIINFELMPRPPSERSADNPWPTWPSVFRVDYGHAEVQLKLGRDPRVYNVMSKVRR